MSNTLIQIRKSTTTAAPAILNIAEPAYSYSSNSLFVGTQDSAGAIKIGGYSEVLKLNAAYTTANAAFDAANAASGGSVINAYNQANNAYDRANVANTTANFANTTAIAAFAVANTKFNSTGGTISGDVNLTGNLNVTGSFISFDTTNYLVKDPLLVLANNNISDVVDIGVIGQYQNGSTINVYTGIFRDSTAKEWYIFDGYTDNFLANTNHINPSGNNFILGVLNAAIRTSNLTLGGANAILSISNALTVANFAFGQANSVYGQANTAYNQANLVFGQANAAYAQANSATANATNATLITTGTLPSGRLTGNYTGITGVGTLVAGVWNGTTIDVPYGGTGRTSFTNNAVLFGNTAGLLNSTAVATEGQVLQGNINGTPVFGMIDGGNF